MDLFLTLAALVKGFHISLFGLLAIGAVLSASGWTPRGRMARVFWPVFFVSILWTISGVPCPLTELQWAFERMADPMAPRPGPLAQSGVHTVLGVVPAREYILAADLAALALGIIGCVRSYSQRLQ